MKSDEINKIIEGLDDQTLDNPIYKSCLGEKIVPYIGWFWRTVNFDRKYCWLGIIPANESEDGPVDGPRAGFMENSKWHHDEFKIKGEQWKNLKDLIINAVKKCDADSFRAVDLYMQVLLPEKYR